MDEGVRQGMKVEAMPRSDRALAQFIERLRKFPRAHPSADFLP